jgi:hypothetical protein
MPLANFEDRLQGVVVGVAIGFDLIDYAEIGELGKVRTVGLLLGLGDRGAQSGKSGLVDIRGGHQAMGGAAYVANLPDQRPTE